MTKIATRPWRIAMVVSRFNEKVTDGLKQGALKYLKEREIIIDHAHVYGAPGAYEIPLLAQAIARTKRFDGIICLGCVIKGDTAHFEFISLGATVGLMHATLETGVPMAFGVITTYDEAQAEARSRDDNHNKGREAAAACIEQLESLSVIRG